MDHNVSGEPWSLAHKIGFRFLLVYVVLYSFPFPFYFPGYPDLDIIALLFSLGSKVLGLNTEVWTGFSGDGRFGYVQIMYRLGLALLMVAIWSGFDKRRPHYRTLARFTIVQVRFFLAAAMMWYGWSKVFKAQFPDPGLVRMMQPVGELSPMGLIWTFMGHSAGYTILAGIAEVVGGVLILFRRTVTLGALILTGVMGNVVAMNLLYDVPVKIYAIHLFLMALGLFLLDWRRLFAIFLSHRATEPVDFSPYFTDARMIWARRVLKTVVIGYFMLYNNVTNGMEGREYWEQKPELYGIYEVESFVMDGEERPALVTDPIRWQHFIVDKVMVGSRDMRGVVTRWRVEIDSEKKSMTLKARMGPDRLALTYEEAEPGTLILHCELDGKTVVMRTRRVEEEFVLLNRGFHWVNEMPFNP